MDKILPIDFDETEAALLNNLKTRADAKKHLKMEGRLLSFRRGLFRSQFFGNAEDSEWKTFAAKLAQVPNTTTIPFYFDGRIH